MSAEWYHGSPTLLTTLRVGSSVTPYRRIAEAFSHKPPRVSMGSEDNDATPGQMTVRHNGTRAGYLYRVAEPVRPQDIRPHPASPTDSREHWEWVTNRPLELELIGPTAIARALGRLPYDDGRPEAQR